MSARRKLAGVIFVSVLLASWPAAAQEGERYCRLPTHDGFLEVETHTGAVRDCKRTVEGYTCAAPAPYKLQSEVGRLTRENEDLKRRIGPALAARPSRRPARSRLTRTSTGRSG
jgi:hypothetical protein